MLRQCNIPLTSTPEAVEILGVGVNRLSLDDLIREATQRVRSGARSILLYANVHVLNTAWGDSKLRAILNRADLVYCDGAGVKLGARLLGHHLPERMTGANWIHNLCQACREAGITLYFLGGEPGVAEEAAQMLRA